MPEFLGVDTSNYTTSAALYISDENRIFQVKRLLPVKEGELGLRQSDAVFHHTKQLPDMIEELRSEHGSMEPAAVSASVRPRNTEGSYMPCFLCGEGFGRSLSAVDDIPFYRTSHQVGHILAALYSADRMDLVNERFIAFHVSGGTTDCLLCEPDDEDIIRITEAGTSLDLKAGQAVDRTGVMLGLKFPCGAELEKLAVNADKEFRVRAVLKEGNCCLSGVENKCRDMLRFRKNHPTESEELLREYTTDKESTGILDALMEIPDKFRIVLTLHYVEGYKVDEIAEMIGKSSSAVKMRLAKGRKLLEEKYRKEFMEYDGKENKVIC